MIGKMNSAIKKLFGWITNTKKYSTGNNIPEAREIWNLYKIRNSHVGDYIDFNNFLHLYEEYISNNRDFVDALVDEIISRINDDQTAEVIKDQLEEHEYDLKIKEDPTVAISHIQEEMIFQLYREYNYPHLRRKNQNKHLREKARKRLN